GPCLQVDAGRFKRLAQGIQPRTVKCAAIAFEADFLANLNCADRRRYIARFLKVAAALFPVKAAESDQLARSFREIRDKILILNCGELRQDIFEMLDQSGI